MPLRSFISEAGGEVLGVLLRSFISEAGRETLEVLLRSFMLKDNRETDGSVILLDAKTFEVVR